MRHMSRSVSRAARRLQAQARSVGAIVGQNLDTPKTATPKAVIRSKAGSLVAIANPSQVRSHAAPNRLGALAARFNDPAGNVFTAKTVGRKRQDKLEVTQGPLVFERTSTGTKCFRDRSQALGQAGSGHIRTADMSNAYTAKHAVARSYALEQAGKASVTVFKANVVAELADMGYRGKVWD